MRLHGGQPAPLILGVPAGIARTLALLAIFFGSSAGHLLALDPRTQLTQYRHSAWRTQEGAFDSPPHVITQASDGYIWIGTDSGLVKFDGVRFTPWRPLGAKRQSIGAVYSLKSSSDGTLWIGTSSRLFGWKDNNLKEYVRGRINSILEDHVGRIWASRSRVQDKNGGLCQIVGDHLGCIGGDDRMRLPYAGALSEDVNGNVWIGSADQLMRWRDGSFETYFRKVLEQNKGLVDFGGITASPDGSVWVAVPARGEGLYQFVNGFPRKIVLAGIDPAQITALLIDRDQSLWIGTSNQGVYRLNGERLDHFGTENGLSSNAVRSFFEDHERNLWVSTSKGLDCFRDSRIVTFSTSEGIKADLVSSALATADGAVWIGNRGALEVLREDKVTTIPIPGRRVTSLWQDHAKRLWVGIDNLLTIYDDGQFKRINRADGSPLGVAIAITEDRNQDVWVSEAPERKLYRIRDLRVQDEYTANQIPFSRLLAADPMGGIWLGFADGNLGHYRDGKLDVFPLRPGEGALPGLMIDADGTVWASTRSGVVHWKNGEMKTLTSKNGLPCEGVFSAIRDNNATLWLYAACGLIGIRNAELERWLQDPDKTIQFQFLDVLDGARPGASTFEPAVSKSPDGRLWFVNDAGLQMLDPAAFQQNRVVPPVHVEQLRDDRKIYAVDHLVHLPAHNRDLEIDYTALSFVAPEKVLFRYKLEGHDRVWQDVGNRRQAFYSDLSPGNYRFRVIACNSDGVWNEAGAFQDFSIAPAYYQTTWFRLLCGCTFLALLWTLYQLRLHQLRRQFAIGLEARVNERTRIARDLHDTLLQSFNALLLRLQTVSNALPGRPDEAKRRIDGAIEQASQAITEGRDAVHELRSGGITITEPGEGITNLVKELLSESPPESAPAVAVQVEGAPRLLNPMVRDEVYRICAEALRNALRHARAKRIEVEIRYEEHHLRLRIRDDGTGIDPAILDRDHKAGHWGLRGMRERAKLVGGTLEVWSQTDSGTEIDLNIPAATAYVKSQASYWSVFSQFSRS